MNLIIPNLGLAKKSDLEFDDYATDIVDKTKEVFTVTSPTTEVMLAAAVAYHEARLKAKHGTPADTADKNAKRKILSALLTELAYDCAKLSNGDEAKFLACGFSIKRKPTPAPPLAAPGNLRLSSLTESEINGEIDSVNGAMMYLWFVGEDSSNPDTFTMAGTSSDTKFKFQNLTSGKRYYAMVYATGSRKKKGPNSTIGTKICA